MEISKWYLEAEKRRRKLKNKRQGFKINILKIRNFNILKMVYPDAVQNYFNTMLCFNFKQWYGVRTENTR